MNWSRRGFVSLSIGAFGCGTQSKGIALRLANVQGIVSPILADALGSFREQGLDVEMSDSPGVSKSVQAMVGGSVDVCVGGLDQAIQLNADGVSVASFFLIGRRPGAALVVSPKAAARIHSVADLKGSVVGVTAPGSTAQWYLYSVMERAGLAPDDVSIAGIGTMATAVAALEQGKVDAAIVLPYPLASLKRRHAGLPVLAEMITPQGTQAVYGVESLPNLCLIAKRAWLDAHGDIARRVNRAMQSTHAWIQSHTPEQMRDRLPAAARLDDAAAELDYLASLKQIYSEDGRMPPGGANDLVRALKLRASDPTRAYTDEFGSPR